MQTKAPQSKTKIYKPQIS